jgi:hypothetical protein
LSENCNTQVRQRLLSALEVKAGWEVPVQLRSRRLRWFMMTARSWVMKNVPASPKDVLLSAVGGCQIL